MQIKTIMQEIQRLPLDKRFLVIEQTLKSIQKDELKSHFIETNSTSESFVATNEKSLAKDWLSEEDSRWDNFL